MGFDVPPPQQQIFAMRSIKETGFLGSNAYWDNLRDARDKNPTQFDKHHKMLAPLLRRDAVQTDPNQQVLNNNNKVYDKWEDRFHLNGEKNFAKYHKGWMVRLVKLDDFMEKNPIRVPWEPPGHNPKHPLPPLDCEPPPPPPVCPPEAVPEPASGLLLGLSLVGGLIFKKLKG